MTNNQKQNIFYQTNYGDTRLIAFEILKKFLKPDNSQKIAEILNEALEIYAKKHELVSEDIFQKIDDEFLHQLLIGFLDNIDEIEVLMADFFGSSNEFNYSILLKLIIYELKFHHENSSQNIFEDYQKIFVINQLKFDKNLFVKLLNQFRDFEMQ